MSLILESKRDDFLNQYIPLLQKRGIETSVGQLKSYLLNKFGVQFGIHSLSKSSNFYLAGVTRYYFEGLLTTNKRLNILYPNVQDKPIQEICVRLDALVDILRNAYIDSVGTQYEQPEDFGDLPLDKLLKKYNKKINQYLGIDTKPTENEETQIDQSTTAGKNYTYEILYSYNDAKKFNQWTTPGAWCITYGEQHYNAYIKRLKIHYVVFMRKGFENVPRKVGKGFTKQKPHDDYGNSLICVLQSNTSPEPIYITSRWNHGYGETSGTEADHAYTKEEFLNVIGCDESVLQRCFEQWKDTVKRNKENSKDKNSKNREDAKNMLRKFKYAQMMISNGANLKDFFKWGQLLAGKFEKPMKSVLLVKLRSEDTGEDYYTICDRGQLKFDQYFVRGGGYYQKPSCNTINNTIISLTNDEKTVFYSIKKRTLLDADGVKQFTHVDYDLTGRGYHNTTEYNHYYMVAARGNQIAVLDTQKGEFLKDPQGHSIFESVIPCQGATYRWWHGDSNVDYRGHIKIEDIKDKGFLKLTYDSSAEEIYLYDLTTNSFLNLPSVINEKGNVSGEIIKWVVSVNSQNAPKGYITYEEKNFRYGNHYKFLNINDGKEFSILGYSIFDSFENFNDLVYGFWPNGVKLSEDNQWGHKIMFYDAQMQNLLKIDGKTLVGQQKNYDYTKGWLVISPTISSNDCYVYNPYTKTFFTDNKGNMLFGYDGGGYNNKNLTLWHVAKDGSGKDVRTDKFELPPAQEYVENVRENVKSKFNILLEKLYKVK